MPASNALPAIREDITRFLAGLLQIPGGEIDPETRFLDLGADSIMLANAADWLDKRYAIQLPMDRFFTDLSTINALAAFLQDARPSRGPSEGQTPSAAPALAGLEPMVQTAPDAVACRTAGDRPTIGSSVRSATAADPLAAGQPDDNALYALLHAQLQLVRQLVTQQNQLLASTTPGPQEASAPAGSNA